MIDHSLDIERCLLSLQQKRAIFHSEADFQFALAWEIQSLYKDANIRLEYCPSNASNTHIDIMVFYLNKAFPIELKYKTAKLSYTKDNERFNLKNHGAQNLGKYDCLKDLQRLELLLSSLSDCVDGYAIWLTNDTSYWNPPSRANNLYEAFSIHHATQKHGCMEWLSPISKGTIKGREEPINLDGIYKILWKDYMDIRVKNGLFRYAISLVNKV